MGDHFLKHLLRRARRFQGVEKTVKKNSILKAIILMLAIGIFFCAFSENYALADKAADGSGQLTSFQPGYAGSISGLRDVYFNLENPMANHCDSRQKKPKKTEGVRKEGKILELVAGYPIEEMIPFLSKRNDKVAYYLVAIAKKESDWGKHSPRKHGGDCYNYWGYRGSYNQTDSGYSCFDSPEQAIQQVGDRIESLLGKMIDTPEEMVVWKCGSTCAGHDPQGVLKWISDVKLYYAKLSA